MEKKVFSVMYALKFKPRESGCSSVLDIARTLVEPVTICNCEDCTKVLECVREVGLQAQTRVCMRLANMRLGNEPFLPMIHAQNDDLRFNFMFPQVTTRDGCPSLSQLLFAANDGPGNEVKAACDRATLRRHLANCHDCGRTSRQMEALQRALCPPLEEVAKLCSVAGTYSTVNYGLHPISEEEIEDGITLPLTFEREVQFYWGKAYHA